MIDSVIWADLAGNSKQQTLIQKREEWINNIKDTIDELINGIQYEDEFYTQILGRMVVNDRNHIDIYLKMLPYRWSFMEEKSVKEDSTHAF